MKKLATQIAAALPALLPQAVLAQGPAEVPTGAPQPIELSGPEDIVAILNNIAGWLFTIFFVLAVIFFIYAAFLYLTAAGNDDRVKSAKNILIYGVVAIVVALLAGGIAFFVSGVLQP